MITRCSVLLHSTEGEGEAGERPGAPLLQSSFNMCYTQPGLRLFLKLVHIEEVIDLFSALPFSACSTLLRAIDLPCKRQIFFHMLWEEFSISNSGLAIPAVTAAHEYLWASALSACSPFSSHTFPFQGQGESCFYCHDSTELVGSGVSQGAGPGRGQTLLPSLSCRSEKGIEQGTIKSLKP